jgi:hypothetical protein
MSGYHNTDHEEYYLLGYENVLDVSDAAIIKVNYGFSKIRRNVHDILPNYYMSRGPVSSV